MINNYKLSEPYNYYNDIEYSLYDPISFWNDVSIKYKVHWDKPYEQVLNYNYETKKSEWFKGGLINACYNALDIKIKNGKGNQIAYNYEIPIKRMKFTITYQQLYDRVCIFSRALRNLGVLKGDVVVVYMHNSFEAIIVMLSCARIGAIHSVLYGGALADNLASNINDCKPKVIVSSNFGYVINQEPHYYLPLLQEALSKSSHKPSSVIVYNRKDIPDIDYSNPKLSISLICGALDWDELIKDLEPLLEYELVESQHPLYLIYTSGTTNKPKGIVRETGGYLVALNYSTRVYFDLKEGDNYFLPSIFGWISSHSYLIYGALLVGLTSVFIEGPLQNLYDMWDMVSRYKVKTFLITPLVARRLRKVDPHGEMVSKYDLSSVKFVCIASEKVHLSLINYLQDTIKKPIINEYWQTESGWQIVGGNCDQITVRRDSIGKLFPGGYQIRIVANKGEDDSNSQDKVIELGPNQIGEIVIKLPLPPGFTNKLFNDDSNSTAYNSLYLNQYPGYYSTGDLGYYDQDGYFFYVSRSGDSITCGTHSINCSIVESEILNNLQISECCIIGIKDEYIGQSPLVLLVLKNDNLNQFEIDSIKSQVSNYLINLIQSHTNLKPIILNIKSLPKNRNGKTLKSIIKSIFNGESFTTPSTIDNINVIDELKDEYNNLNNNIKSYTTLINNK